MAHRNNQLVAPDDDMGKIKMSYAQENFEAFQKNELKSRSDTFRFDCKMCGECCRKRSEPILINGADKFRMARALGLSVK